MNWQDAFAEELSQEWESAPQEEAPADESVALETGTVVNPTLILKEDASPAPVNYGLQSKQKDMFSPLKLQTMFEPPPNSSQMSDIPEESEEDTTQHALEAAEKEFTFTCPPDRNSWKAMNHFLGHSQPLNRLEQPSPMHSTPPQSSPLHISRKLVASDSRDVSAIDTPSKPPNADKTPRPLKLFQFAYDTFTRQHLESLVEEIDERAVPTNDVLQPEWDEPSFSQETEEQRESSEERHSYRSAKRIRLSPENDFRQDFRVPLATPRSVVRDRIRDRRRAFTAIAANGTPFKPLSHTSFSLPTSKMPQSPETARRAASQPEADGQENQPVADQDDEDTAQADPVVSRLQQAQAMMDRIRSQPPERSASSYDDSSSSSSSVDEQGTAPGPERAALPDLDEEPMQLSSMPRMHSHSPSRGRVASRSSGYFGSSATVVGSIKSSDQGTIKALSSVGTVRINASLQEPSHPPIHDIFADSKQSSLESRTSAKQASLESRTSSTATQQQQLAAKAEASLRKSLAQASTLSKSGPGALPGSRRVSASSATSNPPAKAQPQHAYTTIPPEQVEHLLVQQQTASRMRFDDAKGRWIKLPRHDGNATVEEARPALAEDDRSSSEDDVFAGIDSFMTSEQPAHQHEHLPEDALPQPQLDDLSDGQLSMVDKELEEHGPMDLYEAAHSKSPPSSPEDLDEQRLLPAELHDAPDFVPSPAPIASASVQPNTSSHSDRSNTSQSQPAAPKFRRPSVSNLMGTPDVFGRKPLVRHNSKTNIEKTLNAEAPQPRSALKLRRASSERLEKSRSVSVTFSDGKKSGRILEEQPLQSTSARAGSALRYELIAPVSFLDDSADQDDAHDQSPSKGSFRAPDLLAADTSARSRKSDLSAFATKTSPLDVSVQSKRDRLSLSQRSLGNATIMTECSFGVSHEALIKYLTDIEPFTPNWELLTSIDLNSKGMDSLVRLKEFLPRLDAADLSNNQLEWLTGLSATIRTLLLQQNRLTSLTSFSHLLNLERLDISSNTLEDLSQLSCLRHLRELKADNNSITSLAGIDKLDGLVKLSLKGNQLDRLDFASAKWQRLEYISLCKNQIRQVTGLDSLKSCVSLNLDHNQLSEVHADKQMPSLRILRLCSNPISAFDAKPYPNLRTLFIDHAELGTVKSLGKLCKLENLSLRAQDGKLALQSSSIAEVRRLYLSYNPLRSFPSQCAYINLTYLELVSCSLSRLLPDSFSSTVPSLQVLNLTGNFLEDLQGLAGLKHLRRLKMTENRVASVEAVVSCITQLPHLYCLDLRLNPLTLSYYSGNIGVDNWKEVDDAHKRTLPDHWFFKRISYRAVLHKSAPSLRLIDALPVERKAERDRIWELLGTAKAVKGA